MRNSRIILAIVLIAATFFSLSFMQALRASEREKQVDTAFLGPKAYKSTFDQTITSAKSFYAFYGKARESIKRGDYEAAIKFLNDSLPHVGIGPEKAMVYSELAEIYRDLEDFNRELKYVEVIPKYTMNEREKLKYKMRAEEIKSILANPKVKNDLSERFPAPPIYGRPFNNYREVVMTQGKSHEYFKEAEKLYYAGKYREAIEKFKMAYAPDWDKNAFIESMLISCFEKLKEYKQALVLLDYTLASRNWGPENRREFEQKRVQFSHLLAKPESTA